MQSLIHFALLITVIVLGVAPRDTTSAAHYLIGTYFLLLTMIQLHAHYYVNRQVAGCLQ